MFVTISAEGTAKEIADLALTLQSRQVLPEIDSTTVAQAICDSRPEAQEKSCN